MSYLIYLLNPLLSLDPTPSNPIFTIFLIATIIAFFIVVLQKLLIDYDRMAELQAEMKELQAEARAAQKSGDPKALAKVQKKQMELMPKNKELMMMQMKPSIITIIPIIYGPLIYILFFKIISKFCKIIIIIFIFNYFK